MNLSKPFEKDDFANSESLLDPNINTHWDPVDTPEATVTYSPDGCPYDLILTPKGALYLLIDMLNMLRELYLKTGNSVYKAQIETLLPRSYKEKSDENNN